VIDANHGLYQFYLAGVCILSGNQEHVVIYANHGTYLFYLVGVYILLVNPEHVVIYTNHGIRLFYLVGFYILSGNPEHVVVYTNHCVYLFYLVGVYILSVNPEHVVVYANHGIYLFYLVGVYILSGNPEHVVLGDDVAVTLTCVTDDDNRIVKWTKNYITVADIVRQCEFITTDSTYNYTCDLGNKIYYLIIPPDAITDGMQNVIWNCLPFLGRGSNTWSLTLSGTYGIR
jgi:hypothetical protein